LRPSSNRLPAAGGVRGPFLGPRRWRAWRT